MIRRLGWWIRWNLRGRPRWTQADIDEALRRGKELAAWLRDDG